MIIIEVSSRNIKIMIRDIDRIIAIDNIENIKKAEVLNKVTKKNMRMIDMTKNMMIDKNMIDSRFLKNSNIETDHKSMTKKIDLATMKNQE